MPSKATLFVIACASASIAAAQTVEMQCAAARLNMSVTQDDCVSMPIFSFITAAAWTAHTIESGDYRLGAIRITANSANTAYTGTSKGPILLVPGLYANGSVYWLLDGGAGLASDNALPERLYNEGYDVWVSTRRGGLYSNGHANDVEGVSTYKDTNPAEYWDFDQQDVGEQDIAALVSYILSTRATETLDSYKVMIVGHSAGTVETTIALQKYPSDMADRVSAVVLQNFCPVPLESRITSVFQATEEDTPGPCDESEESTRRALKRHKSPKGHKSHKHSKSPDVSEECAATWDKYEFYDRLAEIKERLDYNEWKMFYKAFKDWKYENKETWKYGGAWQAKVTELACEIDNTPIDCASDFYVDSTAYRQFILDNEVYQTYGTDGQLPSAAWQSVLADVCDADGIAEQPFFCNARIAELTTSPFLDAVSTEYESSYSQNVAAKGMVRPSDTFLTDGWYAEVDKLDLDLITVPFMPIYLTDDSSCEYQLARDIADEIPSLAQSHTYHDSSRAHFLFTSYTDPQIFEVVDSMLELYAMQAVDNDSDVTTWDN